MRIIFQSNTAEESNTIAIEKNVPSQYYNWVLQNLTILVSVVEDQESLSQPACEFHFLIERHLFKTFVNVAY